MEQALGSRLEEMLEESGPTVQEVVSPITDEETKRNLRSNDEEEDFLDEGTEKKKKKKQGPWNNINQQFFIFFILDTVFAMFRKDSWHLRLF